MTSEPFTGKENAASPQPVKQFRAADRMCYRPSVSDESTTAERSLHVETIRRPAHRR
jgi:hypothetical protein